MGHTILKGEIPLPTGATNGRLESWKEIAAYLKRDLRTVQRWEKLEGLPVHRHMHRERGSVYAFVAELDAWRDSGRVRSAGVQEAAEARVVGGAPAPEGARPETTLETAAEPTARRRRRWLAAAGAATIGLFAIVGAIALRAPLA